MKEKNNKWKRRWLGLAYFSLVLPLYRNHPIDFLPYISECLKKVGISDEKNVKLKCIAIFATSKTIVMSLNKK